MITHFDARRFERLHFERGVALRELALETGIGLAVLNRIEQGTDPDHTGLTLGQFIRLSNYLGVAPTTLLTTRNQESVSSDSCSIPDDSGNGCAGEPLPCANDLAADVRALGAILHDLKARIRIAAFAEAVQWTIQRLHAAADQLDTDLAPTGMRIHRIGGVISIRAIDDTHHDKLLAVRRHPDTASKCRSTSPQRARLVHQILTSGKSTNTLSHADRQNLSILMRAGVLEQDRNVIIVTDDVRKSLFLEEG